MNAKDLARVIYRPTGQEGILARTAAGEWLVVFSVAEIIEELKGKLITKNNIVVLEHGEADFTALLRPINTTAQKLILGVIKADWGGVEEDPGDTIPLEFPPAAATEGQA